MSLVTSPSHFICSIPPISPPPSLLVLVSCAACPQVWAILQGDSLNPAPEMLINSAAAVAMASKQQHFYRPQMCFV